MRNLRVPGSVFALFIVTAFQLVGQEKGPQAASPDSIEELIGDLGSPSYATREKAQEELWKRGDNAIPALERAIANSEPEIARRAAGLLSRFSWGIRSDTSASVVKNLRQFQAGDLNPSKSGQVRTAALAALMQQGPEGMAVVRAILANPLPSDIHEEIVSYITTQLHRDIPICLFEGNRERAAELMSLHLSGTGSDGAADFAVFQTLQGRLVEAIAAAGQVKRSHRESNTRALVLAHLYRAHGDWPQARSAAAEIPAAPDAGNLVDSLREEERDWPTLADTALSIPTNHPEALHLSYLRLSGRQSSFEKEIDRIKQEVARSTDAKAVEDAVVAMFANHRIEDGTRMLQDHKQNLGLLAETLIARLRYKEALDLSEHQDVEAQKESFPLQLRRARLLFSIGKTGEALALFNNVAERLRVPPSENIDLNDKTIRSVRSLIRTEVKIGLSDLARTHAALFLTCPIGHLDEGPGETCFEILFGQDAVSAETLFWALRTKYIKSLNASQIMKRVNELTTGKADKVAVDEALECARLVSEAPSPKASLAPNFPDRIALPRKVRSALAVAAVCRSAKRDADADAAYQSAVNSMGEAVKWMVDGPRSWVFGTSDASRPWLEWGDYLVDRGRFAEAARRFEEGWREFPSDPVLLFLSGKAISQAGERTEGVRRMELSHWVSLGQEQLRGRFLDELVRRGEGKAAERECELLVQACWPRNHYFGNIMNQAARAAVLNGDFALAEKCIQRSLLVILRTPGVYFVENSAYLSVPHDMQVFEAKAMLAAGEVDRAVALARESLALVPGHLDLVSGMVAELDRQGRQELAEELFRSAWSAYQQVLLEFPESPAARHSLAALAASCRRELKKGLEYAEIALKSHPDSIPFRETLAEILFRNGKRDEALETMRQLAQESPRNQLFKRQLLRYRSASLDSPRPDRADE